MKLSKGEVELLREIVNQDNIVWCFSPRMWRELGQVRKLGKNYPFRTSDSGCISVTIDKYPPRLTSRERKNRLKETSEDRH